MKKLWRFLLSVTMVLSVAAGMVQTAFAAESKVIFRRGSEWFTFEPGSGYSTSDLFDNFKDVMPGDILTETITITNKNPDPDSVRIYLRTEAHDADNPLSYSESYENRDGKDQQGIPGRRDETAVSMADFLSQLTMRVYNGDKLIYEGSPGSGPDSNLYLGSITRYRSLKLKVELEVPVELDNRYADRVGEVDWVFTAQVYKDPMETDVPKTGDNIAAAVTALAISSGLLLLAVLGNRKRK